MNRMNTGYWRRAARWGSLIALALTVSGCDYWPPALQVQIEQLRTDLQTATTERAKLESQLSETTKLKDELQVRIEALGRENQHMTTRISGLEAQVQTFQEKLNKAATGKKPAPAKSPKPAAKKKPGRAA